MNRVKTAMSIVSIAVLIFIYTRYLDGDIGVILASFFLISPLVSWLCWRLCRNRIRIVTDVPSTIERGREFTIRLRVQSDSPIPLPLLTPQIVCSPHWEMLEPMPVLSPLPNTSVELVFRARALHIGASIVESRIAIDDFLGFFHMVQTENTAYSLGIVPCIPNLSGAESLMRGLVDQVRILGEEEESLVVGGTNTTPGYIHRAYVEGDHLRKINWKLSAKRGTLMVRMDEQASMATPMFLLDITAVDDFALRDRIIEGSLGMANCLVTQGVAVTMVFPNCGQWQSHIANSPEDVEDIAQLMGTGLLEHATDERIPTLQGGVYLVWSAAPDIGLYYAMHEQSDDMNVVLCHPVEHVAEGNWDTVWMLHEDFHMEVSKCKG